MQLRKGRSLHLGPCAQAALHPGPCALPTAGPPSSAGKFGEWRFDKRSYAARPPPRNLKEPPEGMKNELVREGGRVGGAGWVGVGAAAAAAAAAAGVPPCWQLGGAAVPSAAAAWMSPVPGWPAWMLCALHLAPLSPTTTPPWYTLDCLPLQVRHLIHAINEATAAIPGWDEYEKTGVATQWWDGVV